jgi:hypothetical protein
MPTSPVPFDAKETQLLENDMRTGGCGCGLFVQIGAAPFDFHNYWTMVRDPRIYEDERVKAVEFMLAFLRSAKAAFGDVIDGTCRLDRSSKGAHAHARSKPTSAVAEEDDSGDDAPVIVLGETSSDAEDDDACSIKRGHCAGRPSHTVSPNKRHKKH